MQGPARPFLCWLFVCFYFPGFKLLFSFVCCLISGLISGVLLSILWCWGSVWGEGGRPGWTGGTFLQLDWGVCHCGSLGPSSLSGDVHDMAMDSTGPGSRTGTEVGPISSSLGKFFLEWNKVSYLGYHGVSGSRHCFSHKEKNKTAGKHWWFNKSSRW